MQGSTVIGALISTLILSIGMAALFNLYINNTLNSVFSQHVASALAHARDKIETLRYHSNNIPVAGSEQIQSQDTLYQRNWLISENSTADYLHTTITIQWHDSSGDHSITLTTVITRQAVETFPFSVP
jgi:Tfp pilus assembly protein PilV